MNPELEIFLEGGSPIRIPDQEDVFDVNETGGSFDDFEEEGGEIESMDEIREDPQEETILSTIMESDQGSSSSFSGFSSDEDEPTEKTAPPPPPPFEGPSNEETRAPQVNSRNSLNVRRGRKNLDRRPVKFPFSSTENERIADNVISFLVPISENYYGLLKNAEDYHRVASKRSENILPLDRFVDVSPDIHATAHEMRNRLPSSRYVIDFLVQQMTDISSLKEENNRLKDKVSYQRALLQKNNTRRKFEHGFDYGLERDSRPMDGQGVNIDLPNGLSSRIGPFKGRGGRGRGRGRGVGKFTNGNTRGTTSNTSVSLV